MARGRVAQAMQRAREEDLELWGEYHRLRKRARQNGVSPSNSGELLLLALEDLKERRKEIKRLKDIMAGGSPP